ncbi:MULTISPECIES: aminoacyl-tRNA deacylase [Uliginosibacterium]|uniref:Cys-tRNA(Pro)/Cys-tRNA(Cys) deacylase n=1 Tax=Uliginosibacterium aquaticum TaxID=2731212 RepID=A0ABX2IMV3_9RHOO|nr:MULTISPECIES: aminoacyl-tRNA deacylase [Uliginosibacterium]MDO6384833.1 aminoacyl-tRNA deacylase [Uliginosibacterium sp. 31-12]NSL55455.1 aminoacyl-tRNA deacylase [Uliginosibacterium aquaticum]PLK48517.1 Cys-tRNA(Pro) deacylase [Uliginosibacterium sp. TH139]
MKDSKAPVTAAIRVLRQHQAEWSDHLYDYEEKGGTAVSSRELGVDEHAVIKTLIMEDDAKRPLIVLMHGDREVSTKNLARHLGVKGITPCTPEVANRHSGYMVGGTSPFGTKRAMPVYLQQSICALPQIYLNGGKRGYLIGISPQAVVAILKPELVDVMA